MTSIVLMAAGMLTCAVAVIDAVAPRGSLAAVLAMTALVGLACWGVLAGLTRACETCDKYLTWHTDRLLSMKRSDSAATPGWHGQ
jgi:hypothetical protein